MGIKLLHTSDWQIGKVFRFVDNATMGLLQEARLKAITRLGELAGKHGIRHILVAGDVYDMEAMSPRSLNQPLERMRGFTGVQWHLLPGNHDPHRPNGLWDQLLRRGLPDNVHVHIVAAPVIFEDNAAVLLPAPLRYRPMLDDLLCGFRSTAAKFCWVAILQTLWTEQENPAEPCHYARAKACIVEYLMLPRTAGSSRLRSDLRFQF